jgi:hypothetical protein
MKWIFGVLIVLILILLVSKRETNRFKRKLINLMNSRPAFSKDDYIAHFKHDGVDELLISTIYNQILLYFGIKNFQLYPDDDLYKLYEISPDDLSIIIENVFKELNSQLPEQKYFDILNEQYNDKPMTIEYIIEIYKIKKY